MTITPTKARVATLNAWEFCTALYAFCFSLIGGSAWFTGEILMRPLHAAVNTFGDLYLLILGLTLGLISEAVGRWPRSSHE